MDHGNLTTARILSKHRRTEQSRPSEKGNQTLNGTEHVACDEQDLLFAEIFSLGISGFYIAIFGGGILLGNSSNTV